MESLKLGEGMDLNPKGLDVYVFHLEAEREKTAGLLADQTQKVLAARTTLEGWTRWLDPERPDVDTQARHGHITAQDLAGCESQRAALEKIALMSDGIVRVTEASELIIMSGLSKGAKASVQATAHRTMSQDEDSWAWVAPGTFRFVRKNMLEATNQLGSVNPQPAARPVPTPVVVPPLGHLGTLPALDGTGQ